MLLDKPDEDVRLIIDFRKLNSQCDCQSFPIGRIEDLIDKVKQSKFLTKLDITKAYWNVKLKRNQFHTLLSLRERIVRVEGATI